ncbi:MAG: response regulator [Pseudomonadota bacterium]|nr:response regulator [Pseudomonadota bacterium]
MRVLLVEDNKTLADSLRRALLKERYGIDWTDDGATADYLLRQEKFDLVVLDLGLPSLPGGEVLRRLRARGDATPVLVLTANVGTESRITQLDQGADDYVAKPFDIGELEARMRALLRRSSRVVDPFIICGDLRFDSNTHEFDIGGRPLALSPRERSVLETLIMKLGVTVTKQALAQSLSTVDTATSVDAVEIHVHRVRKRLEGSEAAIVTLRGMGYILRPAHHE